MADWIDVSMPITGDMLRWPSDPPVGLRPFKTLEEQGSNVTEIHAGSHLGTHVDAPRHNLADGAGVDEFPPDTFVGPAVVVDATAAETEILPEHVEAIPDGARRILFRTRNSDRRLLEKPFTENYVGLSAEAAKSLASRDELQLVGIDYCSIQRRGPDSTPHTALLERGIAIVEGLELSVVEPGDYDFVCLPLRIAGGDGAPARALLKRSDP